MFIACVRIPLKLVIMKPMILFRPLSALPRVLGLAALYAAVMFGVCALGASSPAMAAYKRGHKKPAQAEDSESKDQKDSSGKLGGAVATFGAWSVLVSPAKPKTCYALAKPKQSAPNHLKRDDAYIFISTRPGDSVRNEVSIKMGYEMKDKSEPKADVGGTVFDLVARGENAWTKNPAQDAAFIDAMKKAGKLVVKATSKRGKSSSDIYILGGLTEALTRVQKECR